MKADTILEYLQRIMDPAPSYNNEVQKPKEWYGWRDTFPIGHEIDHSNIELPAAHRGDTTAIKYTRKLADK